MAPLLRITSEEDTSISQDLEMLLPISPRRPISPSSNNTTTCVYDQHNGPSSYDGPDGRDERDDEAIDDTTDDWHLDMSPQIQTMHLEPDEGIAGAVDEIVQRHTLFMDGYNSSLSSQSESLLVLCSLFS